MRDDVYLDAHLMTESLRVCNQKKSTQTHAALEKIEGGVE